jgi:hypothetical protein
MWPSSVRAGRAAELKIQVFPDLASLTVRRPAQLEKAVA